MKLRSLALLLAATAAFFVLAVPASAFTITGGTWGQRATVAGSVSTST